MIYIIVNDYDYIQGGASKVAIETANLLYEQGKKVLFFCGISDSEKSTLNPKIPLVYCNQKDCLTQKNISGALQGIRNKKAEAKFKEILLTYDEDVIVHVHGWTKCLSSSFLKSIKYKKNIKCILTLHDCFSVCPNGGFFNYKTNRICHKRPLSFSCFVCNCDSRNYLFKLYRFYREFYQNKIVGFLKKFDKIITISELQKEVLSPFFPHQEFTFVYNPTSISNKPEKRVEVEANHYYLYMGRLTKDKGIDLLCDHFSKINEKLVVIGTGYLENDLKEKYSNVKNIQIYGWKSQEETYEYLRKARALFVPSVYYEGAPLTVFEGLAFGVPIVVSNLCAGKNFVDERNGILINPYSYDDFKNAIELLKVNETIEHLSKNAFELYWANPFDTKRYIDSLLEVYNELNGD